MQMNAARASLNVFNEKLLIAIPVQTSAKPTLGVSSVPCQLAYARNLC
jgi:hypothetical protein